MGHGRVRDAELERAQIHDCAATLHQLSEARVVLAKLLALPHAKYELSYLDRGIGTSTESAVWLDVRRIVEGK